jgi:hypothetical protein
MSFIVTAYYTRNTLYEQKVQVFEASLQKFNIPYHIKAIENKGDWYKNTGYKPTFLKEMLKKFPMLSIVYVDVDAEFLRYPDLFETYDQDIGVYVFDRSCYKKSAHGFEVLSGTIFLKNNEKVYKIIEQWENECKENPRIWDQRSLEKILNGNYSLLPGEYCRIFDRMEHITNPVIVHYQASREIRRNKGRLTS